MKMKIRTAFRYLVLIVLVACIIIIAKWKVTDLCKFVTSSVHLSYQTPTNEKRPNDDLKLPDSSSLNPDITFRTKTPTSNVAKSEPKFSDTIERRDKQIKNTKVVASRIFSVNQNKETTPLHLNTLIDRRAETFNQSNYIYSKDSSSKPNKEFPLLSIIESDEVKVDVVAERILEMNQPGKHESLPKIYISRKTENGSRKLELKYGNFSSRCQDLRFPIQDLFCMNKLPYLEDVKNPCWYEGVSAQNLKLRCLPYFVILGCAKCATTDLHSRLVKHRHILKNDGFLEKESLYWAWKKYGISNHKLNGVETFEGFTSDFNPLADSLTKLIHQKSNLVQKLIIGDASPPDFWDFRAWPLLPQNEGLKEPEVFTPQLMQYIYRNPKFILLLRNPTDRLYSDYFFLQQGNTPGSFHEAVVYSITVIYECLSHHSQRYCFFSSKLFSKLKCRIHFGCYSIFLKEWFHVFKRDQFYIARMEDYSQDIESHIEEIYKFLKVEPVSQSKMDKIESQNRSRVTASKKKSSPMLLKTQKILDKFYEKYNRQLAKLLRNNKFVWSESNVLIQKKLRLDTT